MGMSAFVRAQCRARCRSGPGLSVDLVWSGLAALGRRCCGGLQPVGLPRLSSLSRGDLGRILWPCLALLGRAGRAVWRPCVQPMPQQSRHAAGPARDLQPSRTCTRVRQLVVLVVERSRRPPPAFPAWPTDVLSAMCDVVVVVTAGFSNDSFTCARYSAAFLFVAAYELSHPPGTPGCHRPQPPIRLISDLPPDQLRWDTDWGTRGGPASH